MCIRDSRRSGQRRCDGARKGKFQRNDQRRGRKFPNLRTVRRRIGSVVSGLSKIRNTGERPHGASGSIAGCLLYTSIKVLKSLIKNSDFVIAHLPSPVGNHAIALAHKTKKPTFTGVIGCAFESMWYYNWKGKLMAIDVYKRQI